MRRRRRRRRCLKRNRCWIGRRGRWKGRLKLCNGGGSWRIRRSLPGQPSPTVSQHPLSSSHHRHRWRWQPINTSSGGRQLSESSETHSCCRHGPTESEEYPDQALPAPSKFSPGVTLPQPVWQASRAAAASTKNNTQNIPSRNSPRRGINLERQR